jgi:pimeloyl-ACP methyl ester carboxylesterase
MDEPDRSAGDSGPGTTARISTVGNDGLVLDVLDTGPLDGEPVVLLHGFPQDHTAWDQVTPTLHEAGLRTFAPDLRGYSPGARPAERRAYELSVVAGDVLALLDLAGLPSAHVVGHDWGGSLAWVLAGLHPSRVRSLVSVSTPHGGALRAAMMRGPQAWRSWYIGFAQLPRVPERVLASALPRTLARTGLPAQAAEHYLARLSEPGALSAALNWYRALPWSLRLDVPRSPVPTTYLWGRYDWALGRTAAEATAQWVAGPYRFVEVDGGHWLPETRALEVATAIIEQVAAAG